MTASGQTEKSSRRAFLFRTKAVTGIAGCNGTFKNLPDILSKRTLFLGGKSGSSKPRLRCSKSARLSMAPPTDLLRVKC
jgi:hypothetical protein